MSESLYFWLMRPIAEVLTAPAIVVTFAILYGLYLLPGYIRQRKCLHTDVHENGRCDACCRDCGKNLGFIGTWRDKQRATVAGGEG